MRISRKIATTFVFCSAFLTYTIITIKHHYCIEESTCLTSAAYLRDSLLQKAGLTLSEEEPSICVEDCDKTIVVGHTNKEHLEWLQDRLPDWQHVTCNVESKDTTQQLTIPQNKGNEAMVYLSYIIDNYQSLPSIMLFIHAHEKGYREAWHVDAPLHDQVHSIRSLKLDYVRQQGYVNLRCILRPGCDAGSGGAKEDVTSQEWNGVFQNTSTPPAWMALQMQSYVEVPKTAKLLDPRSSEFYITKLPPISVTCCAQFAVTRDVVLQRPRSDYIAFRQWLLDSESSNARSGGVWEYLWHIVFGEQAQLCPDPEFCYCALYGKC